MQGIAFKRCPNNNASSKTFSLHRKSPANHEGIDDSSHPITLPSHFSANPRCEYCTVTDKDDLYQCKQDNCGRWFCNSGRIQGAQGSHIVHHLTSLGHNTIALHRNNKKLERPLVCVTCNSINIFSLGYLDVYDEIICRIPCLHNLQVEALAWRPIVREKVLSFEFHGPSEEILEEYEPERRKENKVGLKHIQRIEEEYMPSQNLGDSDEDEVFLQNTRIKKSYANLIEYVATFNSLLRHDVSAEAMNHHKTRILNVNFNFADNRRSGFIYGGELGCKFGLRDIIIIELGPDLEAKGKLVKIEKGKYFIELDRPAPRYVEKVNMSVEFNKCMNNRLNKGLDKLKNGDLDADIIDIILGKKSVVLLPFSYNEMDYSVPKFKKLNSSQNLAVRNALKYKVSIIEGPPGTGKTETIVALCYNILLLMRNSEDELLDRKNMNRNILESLKEVLASGKAAREIGEAAALKCADAEKVSKNSWANHRKMRKEFENELKKEIYEIIEKKEELSKQMKDMNNTHLRLNPGSSTLRANYLSQARRNFEEFNKQAMEMSIMECKIQNLIKNKEKSENIRKNHRVIPYVATKPPPIPNLNDIPKHGSEDPPANITLLNSCYNPSSKLLVCASSNTAVTLLANKISNLDTKVIHIYARYKEKEFTDDVLSLHYQVKKLLRDDFAYQNIKSYFHKKPPLPHNSAAKPLRRNNLPLLDPEFDSNNSSSEASDQDSNSDIDQSSSPALLSQIPAGEMPNTDLFLLSKLIGNPSLSTTDSERLSEQLKARLKAMRKEKEISLIEECNVICCTCITSCLPILDKFTFQHVIIDEATQSLEPETVQSFLKGTTHIVLVGDIMQLGAVVKSRTALELGLDVSFIERMLHNEIPRQFLSVQYRMHPKIAEFSNTNFYQNRLQNGVGFSERQYPGFAFPDPVGRNPTFFYHIESREEAGGSGASYLNRYEASVIRRILLFMIEKGVPAKHIAVITFYDAQRAYLDYDFANSAARKVLEEVEVLSVDASQGREKEFIVLSCVRGNDSTGVGFLDEYRRLNVAMTRAIYGLIVCGNALTLITNKLWRMLFNYYQDAQMVFTGDFENLDYFELDTGIEEDVIDIGKKHKYQ